jgi:phosphoribosyl 1,2-cyclic phosphodiesterase
MRIRFWGVRGSLPAPPSSFELRDKIFKALAMALETRLKPWDIPSFISMLPHEVKSFVGGNTPCLEISHQNRILIFDAGTGIRALGRLFTPAPSRDLIERLERPGAGAGAGGAPPEGPEASGLAPDAPEGSGPAPGGGDLGGGSRGGRRPGPPDPNSQGPNGAEPGSAAQSGQGGAEENGPHEERPAGRRQLTLDLFLTHTHWDHIQGLPFFAPIYSPDTVLNIYGTCITEKKKDLVLQQSRPSLFPIGFGDLPAKIVFHEFPETGLELSPFTIDSLPLPHPGGCDAFRVRAFGKTAVFATDYEISSDSPDGHLRQEALKEFIANADIFISDTQYSYTESHAKEGWGHSSAFNIVELAAQSGVKRLYLFHHDPSYDDQKLYDIQDKAASLAHMLFPQSTMAIRLAVEDTVVDLLEEPE